MNWDDLRYFLAIARSASLSAAGRQLNVSQPTMSRRLAALERRFGVKLFTRTREGLELSIAGAQMFEAVQDVEESLTAMDRKISGQDQRLDGPLRITCTEAMASLYLIPHLARFAREHPDIELDIKGTFQKLSLSRREADVAIRMTHTPTQTLIGRRLADTAVCAYGARDSRVDDNPQGDGAGPGWIGWHDDTYNRMMITKPFPRAEIRHRVDDMQTMLSLARAGLGVAVLPCYMGDTDAGLRRVRAEAMHDTVPDLWVLSHPDTRRIARVRVFVEFITRAILADRDLFEGRRPRRAP